MGGILHVNDAMLGFVMLGIAVPLVMAILFLGRK